MRLAGVWIAGALLIAISAAARGSSQPPVASRPVQEIPTATELVVSAEVPSNDDAPEIPDSKADVVVSLVSTPEPLNDSQRLVIEFWRAWRSQAVDALPDFLREKSEHRASIEETYQMALRIAGIAEGADVEIHGGFGRITLEMAPVDILSLRDQSQLTFTGEVLSERVVLSGFFKSE